MFVQWDQPGAGKTYIRAGNHQPKLTLEGMTNDGTAVAEYVRNGMHQSKVMLIGEDWGSLLDLKMIEQRPDLFVAYVGTDPLVSWIAKQDVEYEYTKSRAAASHDQKTLDALNQAGPPPYRSLESYRRVPRLLPPEATQQSLAWGESWHTRQACQSRSCLGGTRGCERAKRT